jgi:hypothetical protein
VKYASESDIEDIRRLRTMSCKKKLKSPKDFSYEPLDEDQENLQNDNQQGNACPRAELWIFRGL